MDVAEACAVLGVDPDASWTEVRTAYRRLMRIHHPDVAGTSRASTAARITEAFATLDTATSGGRRPAHPTGTTRSRRPPPRPRSRASDPTTGAKPPATTVSLDVGDENILDALVRGGTALGRVGPVDRESGVVVITLGPPRWAPSQLLAEIGGRAGQATVEFTLESLGNQPGPPIEAVVAALAGALGGR